MVHGRLFPETLGDHSGVWEDDNARQERMEEERRNTPDVNFSEVVFYIDEIPAGKWQQPEPYHIFSHLLTKKEAEESFIIPFMKFVDEALQGQKLAIEGYEKKQFVSGEKVYLLRRFLNYFAAARVIQPGKDSSSTELIESIHRAVTALLSAETRKEFGFIDQTPVSAEDISNAKRFIDYCGRRYTGRGLKEFEKQD